jgi:hypothetical protein
MVAGERLILTLYVRRLSLSTLLQFRPPLPASQDLHPAEILSGVGWYFLTEFSGKPIVSIFTSQENCLTLEDVTNRLPRNVGNYQPTRLTSQRSEVPGFLTGYMILTEMGRFQTYKCCLLSECRA